MLIFTKAFDSLVRQNIYYTLIHYGVRGEIVNIIKSLYNNINLRVKHNNELSEAFNCYVGVFQGDCLSVFSFSIYVNDLEQFNEDVNR